MLVWEPAHHPPFRWRVRPGQGGTTPRGALAGLPCGCGQENLFPMRLQASGSGLFDRTRAGAMVQVGNPPPASGGSGRCCSAHWNMGWPTETRHELIPHITIARYVPVGSGNGRDPGSPSPAAHRPSARFTAADPSMELRAAGRPDTLLISARCRPAVGPEWTPVTGRNGIVTEQMFSFLATSWYHQKW